MMISLTPWIRRYYPVTETTAGAVVWLAIIAFLLLFINVLGLTVSTSVFLAEVGAEQLPLVYIIMGALSLPLYGYLAHIVDQHSRSRLIVVTCIVGVVIALSLALLVETDHIIVLYFAFIFFNFQWAVQISVLFPSLQYDYLNTVEYKRFTVLMAVALAIGGIVGGAVAGLLGQYLPSASIFLLLVFPYLLLSLIIIHGAHCHSILPVEVVNDGPTDPLDLKFFLRLSHKYPILLLLSGSTFFYILLYTIAEYQYFSIYSTQFPNEGELTTLFGVVRIFADSAQLLLLFFGFGPLLQRFGLSPLALIYPITTLLSFAALAISPTLAFAIMMHLNIGPVETAFNQPVHNLNYNAVPHRHLGLARSVAEGLTYAFGLALGGLFLWWVEDALDPSAISLLGVVFALLFIVVRFGMAKTFLHSLVTELRHRTIPLEQDEALGRLPKSGCHQVRELLQNSDEVLRVLGLRLAVRLKIVAPVSQAITSVLADIPYPNSKIIMLLRQHGLALPLVEWGLSGNIALARYAVVAALLAKIRVTTTAQNDPVVFGLLCWQQKRPIVWSRMDPKEARYLFQVAKLVGDVKPLSCNAIAYFENAPQTLVTFYQALAAAPLVVGLEKTVLSGLQHPNIEVQQAAANCTAHYQSNEITDWLFHLWTSAHYHLRDLAIHALAKGSHATLQRTRWELAYGSPPQQAAAIATLSASSANEPRSWAREWLLQRLVQAQKAKEWQHSIPAGVLAWKPLQVAIEDCKRQLLNQILEYVAQGEHRSVVAMAQTLLASSSERDRANALETISSLQDPVLLLPALRLIEPLALREQVATTQEQQTMLYQAGSSDNVWLRSGALATAQRLAIPLPQNITGVIDMNRILVLKQVDLFRSLPLDEITLIADAMESQEWMAGEWVLQEGNIAQQLYVVEEGQVDIVKGPEKRCIALRESGQYFGEIALFLDLPRSAGAIARTECTLLTLEKSRFVSLVRQRPDIALEMCRVLSQHLRDTTERIV